MLSSTWLYLEPVMDGLGQKAIGGFDYGFTY